ncbi:MAG: YkgJ family cysteine cluster protein [Myxococcota bacterium]
MSEALKRLRVHLLLIDEGVAPVVTRYREHIQCAEGCSDCCHQTFRVSALEGALLREGLAEAPPAERADIERRAEQWHADSREPCPVLSDDGRCRLYAHRPRICRKYGIPLWHPDQPERVTTCPKNFQGMADIDAELVLDPQAAWAADWIRLREALNVQDPELAPIAVHLRTQP